ncbi:MAG: DUF5119 domain-containing protein [Muribaculaceae bacterium]|nr:DUF5119 domain-containing protein [Muribaculaceae bacterium]
MKTSVLIPSMAILALSASSCLHKDLDFEVDDRGEVDVVFDWRNAPDADPSSMLTYFYPSDGGNALLYTFVGKNGGRISIPYGYYAGIGINGDNADWAGMRNTDDPEQFEVFTRDAVNLEGYGIQSRSVPRAAGTEDERMAKTPGMIWSNRQNDVDLSYNSIAAGNVTHTITFYPEETVCHYTVDILDIEHSEYLHGAEVDATLSGMAEGYLHGKRTTTDVAVTMPFVLQSVDGGKALTANFLTFGECSVTARRHMLTVYVYLTDGTKWYHTYDVTDQVTSAPDPRHVHIIVRGLDLPQPIAGGSGFRPDVNDWNDININLPMTAN